MRLKRIVITSLCLIIFLSIVSQAQDAPPNVPYIQHNVCPFECCQYGKWIARSGLTAYKKEDGSSSIAFTIKLGEQFTAIRGDVHIVKLGLVILKKSFDNYAKDDKVYILSYRGEGVYDLWYKGKVLNSEDNFWENSVLMQLPKMIWWVLVESKNGKQGWLKLENISESGFRIEEKIDGMDSCS